jgi:hypothetical protein
MTRIDRWGVLVVVGLHAVAPAFGQDDAALFNYMNNVTGTHPVFYYLGYVPLLPELFGYALGGLPFVAQALLYRVLPLAVMLILYAEWRRLLGREGDQREAAILTLSAILMLRSVGVNMWANLMMMIAPMLVAAVLHALRLGRESGRYSVAGMALMVIAAVSMPFGILLAPVLLLQWPGDADRSRRSHSIALAIAVVAGYLLLNWRFLGGSVTPRGPREIASLFRHGLTTEYRLNNVIAIGATLVLSGACLRAWRNRSMAADTRLMTIVLAGVGLVSIGGVLISDRLPFNDGGFAESHVLPALCAMLLVVSTSILAIRDSSRRAMLIGVFAGVALFAISGEMYRNLRGPGELAVMKYQFLRTAQDYRARCNSDTDVGLSFEDSDDAPIVLCRPRAFEEGLHWQFNLTPAYGDNDPGAPPEEHPFIYAGRAVF